MNLNIKLNSMKIKCLLCESDNAKLFWKSKKLFKCNDCGVLFNNLKFNLDYKLFQSYANPSNFDNFIKYSIRDFNLIKNNIKHKYNILEIGGAFGFLSERILEKFNVNYYHFEANKKYASIMRSKGLHVLDKFDECISIDLIILAHCLEHIKNADDFINELCIKYPYSDIILYQTNPNGFIPKYLPWFWYGWSFNQHYFHFTLNSLVYLSKKYNFDLNIIGYYSLDQEISFSIKGIIKSILKLLNFLIKDEYRDAYVVLLKKNSLTIK